MKSGTLTAIAAGVALRTQRLTFAQTRVESLGYQIPMTAQQEPTYMFTSATFKPYVGGVFQAPDARGRMVSMNLLSVTTYNPSASTKISSGPTRQTDCFSLMFKAARELPPLTSIHKVSHPSLGTFDLFLTPRPQDNGSPLYEAVFNHI